MLIAILAVTQSWWVIWEVRTHEFQSYFEFMTIVIPQAIFFLIAFLLSPPITPGQPFDLREYYFRQVRWCALLFPLCLAGIAMSRIVLGTESLVSPVNGLRLLAIVAFGFLGFSKSPRIHEAAVVVVSSLLLLAISLTSFQGT